SNHPPGLHGNGKPGNRLEDGHHGNGLEGERYGSRVGFLVSFPLRTNYMFARVRGAVRSPLVALSACLWLRPSISVSALGAPFSYAAPEQNNEFLLLAWAGRPLEMILNDQ
ncbi:NPTX1 protein, partial [Bombycilla garrulus]|nr:NPTX1 protein [Bombycilla garrulus]